MFYLSCLSILSECVWGSGLGRVCDYSVIMMCVGAWFECHCAIIVIVQNLTDN